MISKIIGLVLMVPFLSMMLAHKRCKEEEKQGKEINDTYFQQAIVSFLFILYIFEAFGFGLYLLFK